MFELKLAKLTKLIKIIIKNPNYITLNLASINNIFKIKYFFVCNSNN